MLFHSQPFLLAFLPICLAAFYACAARPAARAWVLIAASLGFYAYWDIRFLPLLVVSVGANWLLARMTNATRGRWPLVAGIALNLALLGLFKYADFFADDLAALFGGRHQPWNLILPLGISFFTFQQISYLIDRGRGRAPAYALRDYALYVTFFPQLIAGPIVRHDEIIGQFAADPRRAGLDERLARGGALLIIGLVKKVFLADPLAAIADPLFSAVAGDGGALSLVDAWIATGAFGGQIYFDFSGYSDMAIGLGLLFGFALPYNFDAPYRARSIRDFWRRWHMTLSRFLRDYLYIPLGGGHHGPGRRFAAVMTTMLLGGLWHGAGWTFVVWGGMHGLALAVNQTWRRFGSALPGWLAWAATFLFVMVAWVPFRAESFAAAGHLFATMAGGAGWSLAPGDGTRLWLIPLALAIAVIGPTSQRAALAVMPPRRAIAALAAVALVLVVLKVGGGDNAVFIYFQF